MASSVSIIICTRDRVADLLLTIDSLKRIEIPADFTAELLIVDNGSVDKTREHCEHLELPRYTCRYVLAERPGKGYAYNAGLAAATGDILLFTDDDVRPPADWIERMCRPIVDGKADAVAGGVRIAPNLEREWFTPLHRSWLAATSGISTSEPLLVGANMAFSKRVVEAVPEFDTALGPGALGFCDETLFTFQLREAGFKIASAFDVEVEHHFLPDRVERPAMLSTAAKMGRSLAYFAYHWQHEHQSNVEIKLAIKELQLAIGRALGKDRTSNPEESTEWELNAVHYISFLKQYQIERRRPYNYDLHGCKKIDRSQATTATAESTLVGLGNDPKVR